jgi:hypothetical protein
MSFLSTFSNREDIYNLFKSQAEVDEHQLQIVLYSTELTLRQSSSWTTDAKRSLSSVSCCLIWRRKLPKTDYEYNSASDQVTSLFARTGYRKKCVQFIMNVIHYGQPIRRSYEYKSQISTCSQCFNSTATSVAKKFIQFSSRIVL